jgi:hypothetical protein
MPGNGVVGGSDISMTGEFCDWCPWPAQGFSCMARIRHDVEHRRACGGSYAGLACSAASRLGVGTPCEALARVKIML